MSEAEDAMKKCPISTCVGHELEARLKAMYAGDIPPESILNGYKVITDYLTKRRDELLDENRLWKAIEDNTWDLWCIDEPTGGGDSDIAWIIIEHHMAGPQERQISYGKTPLEAIEQALKEKPHEE